MSRTLEEANLLADDFTPDSAFPIHFQISHSGGVIDGYRTGLSKRDYFASAALQGMLAAENDAYSYGSSDMKAKYAVELADALLKALYDE